ncbi:hypothetical protein HYALB_00000650 [Hymenoscyphus albidus]|uniref:Uncharacterized protein n=1 Tax=Hymenoscyphus albidus TaxID=595503 RepID=A0A9N9M5I6_9HELO|nr:hypothetical protein HYALB_00000650 [Hymenoscyphus albidus]
MDLSPGNLYIALSARNIEGSYVSFPFEQTSSLPKNTKTYKHWGLIQPTSRPSTSGIYHHATISSATNGKWLAQTIAQPLPMTERALILIWRVGPISATQERFEEIMASIPADGEPSARTGKDFNCRTWMFDVLAKLEVEGGLKLGVEIDEIEKKAIEHAHSVENDVVAGKRGPLVMNDDIRA